VRFAANRFTGDLQFVHRKKKNQRRCYVTGVITKLVHNTKKKEWSSSAIGVANQRYSDAAETNTLVKLVTVHGTH
jgi:hypothetical protein